MPDPEAFRTYLRRIEETFISLRGTPFVLAPSDVQLIQSWFERELPAEVVEEAVREIFQREQARDQDRKISSLKYCSLHVETRWKERRHRRAGTGHQEGAALDLPALLDANGARLEAFLAAPGFAEIKCKKGAAWKAKLAALKETAGAEEVETGLKEVQDAIAEAAWSSLSKEEKAHRETRVRSRLEKELAPLSAQAQKLLVKTLAMDDLMEEFALPRLTLL